MSEDPDGPIEIELTAHAPKPARGRRTVEPSATTSPAAPAARLDASSDAHVERDRPASESGWLGSERSRLLVSVSAAAVVALLIGWMLGRSGGESAPASEGAAPPETTVADEPEPDPAFGDAEELPDTDVDADDVVPDPEEAPATAPPVVIGPPPDTEQDEDDESVVERLEPEPMRISLDDRVAGLDLTLITVDGARRLLEVDLSTGIAEQRGEQLPSAVDGLIGGPDWIATIQQGSGRLLIDGDDGMRSEIPGLEWWNLAVDSERAVLWTLEPNAAASFGTYQERDLQGRLTGRVIEMPLDAWPAIYDGEAFLTSVIGVAYRIGVSGNERVADGQILAASDSTLVLNDCDDELACGLKVVDRATGEARWLPPGPGEFDRRYISLQSYFGSHAGPSLSPDGRLMTAVVPGEGPPEVGLLDLTTGEFRVVEGLVPEGFGISWTWAPDGRTAFFVRNGTPWMYDRASGTSFEISPDRLSWSGLVLRSNGGE